MSKTPLSLYSSYYIDSKVDSAAVTNYGGIFPYLDLMLLTDLPKLAGECLPEKSLHAWQHAEHIAALLALNLTGGDCVDDLAKLADDPGIGLYMGQIAKSVVTKNRKFTRGGNGNVPPAYRNLEALAESIKHLNDELGITDVWVRSDAAAHQEAILKALSEWKIDGNPNPVNFAIGYIKTKEFRKALKKLDETQWEPVFDKKGRLDYEVAEVPFVSNTEALIKAEPYRHIAIRRKSKQGILPGLDTNDGKLADGQLPSNKFGVNAAWWSVVVLAHNLHALLEKLAMPNSLVGSRFKRLRYHLINVPARVVTHARACCVRYFQSATLYLVQHIRGELATLATALG